MRTEQQTLLSQAFKLGFKSECFLCVYSLSSPHTARIMSLSVKNTMGKQFKYLAYTTGVGKREREMNFVIHPCHH